MPSAGLPEGEFDSFARFCFCFLILKSRVFSAIFCASLAGVRIEEMSRGRFQVLLVLLRLTHAAAASSRRHHGHSGHHLKNVTVITGEDPEREKAYFNLMYTYHYSLYLTHFHGDKGYRETLRVALTGAILLAVDSSIAIGKTSQTCQDFIRLIERALGEQLDWSLDDLGFEPSEVEDLRNGVLRPQLYNRLRALADKP